MQKGRSRRRKRGRSEEKEVGRRELRFQGQRGRAAGPASLTLLYRPPVRSHSSASMSITLSAGCWPLALPCLDLPLPGQSLSLGRLVLCWAGSHSCSLKDKQASRHLKEPDEDKVAEEAWAHR